MDQHLLLLKQFVNNVRANTDILHEPAFDFFKEFMEDSWFLYVYFKVEPPIPYPTDIDNSGVIEPDDNSEPLPMGDPSKEATDEDLEKANEARDKAMEAFSDGNFDDALKYYTEAIELNPGLAILHAKRANVLLKLKRPVAAIADCDKAISINADSAQGYKFRGRAYR
ncbi:unnamed protein product [Nippostrongylus brasiliensis]|uniref:Hsc70-interacting protein (inferred by orthology to a human protein) n=1 Tax=Nippostrongylus brasiliensis TaxID=27835 RepID=A0A0N4YTW3_NIPBR|nr:unnamed protein product [Nippostrongylus brasiliensis]